METSTSIPPQWDNSDNDAVPKCAHRGLSNEAVTVHSLHISSDAIIVVVPVLAACLRWGAGSFFQGPKRDTGNNEDVGGIWSSAHGASCQRGSCARSADKEGGLVFNWGGVQPNSDWVSTGGGEGGEYRHTSDESLYLGRGPQRTKRHKDRLFLPAKTEGHSGIWDSIHPTTA